MYLFLSHFRTDKAGLVILSLWVNPLKTKGETTRYVQSSPIYTFKLSLSRFILENMKMALNKFVLEWSELPTKKFQINLSILNFFRKIDIFTQNISQNSLYLNFFGENEKKVIEFYFRMV